MDLSLLSNIEGTGALNLIVADIILVLQIVAPIAFSILGIFLVWRYGMKFFKSMSK